MASPGLHGRYRHAADGFGARTRDVGPGQNPGKWGSPAPGRVASGLPPPPESHDRAVMGDTCPLLPSRSSLREDAFRKPLAGAYALCRAGARHDRQRRAAVPRPERAHVHPCRHRALHQQVLIAPVGVLPEPVIRTRGQFGGRTGFCGTRPACHSRYRATAPPYPFRCGARR